MTRKFKCLQKIHGPLGIAGMHSKNPKEMPQGLKLNSFFFEKTVESKILNMETTLY